MFNNILFYIILGLSASTLGLGWLSLSLHDDKVVAVHALKQSQETIAGYEKSLNLKYLSCEINDTITSEYQSEKQAQQGKTHAVISKIDSLPSKKQAQVQHEETDVVDIDGKLPSDLQRLLSEASDNHQRGSPTNAK